MSKEYEWKLNIEGIVHLISYTPRKNIISVDGVENTLVKRNFLQYFTGVDQPITVGNYEVRFTTFSGKPDIAYNGYYLNSKKQYVPLSKMEVSGWIYIVLCIVEFFVGIGGAIPMVLGVLGVYFNVKIALSPKLNKLQRIIFGLLLTVLIWLLFGLVFCLSLYLRFKA